GPTTVRLPGGQIPAGVAVGPGGQLGDADDKGHFEPFQAGRLTYDRAAGTLNLHGVLPDNQRDRIIEATAPAGFKKKVEELAKASRDIDGNGVKSAEVTLDEVPPGFDMKYAGLKKSVVAYRPDERKLVAYAPLREKETKGLLVAAG